MIGKGAALRVAGSPQRGRVNVSMVAVLAVALTALGASALLASAQTETPAAGASACPAGTPAGGSSGSGDCVSLGEYDIYYNPNLITIPASTGVKFVITNHGATEHNFSISDHKNPGLTDLHVSVFNQPGQTSKLTINAPAGDYYFYCTKPGHEQAGMFGYITVKADATITTSEATVTPPRRVSASGRSRPPRRLVNRDPPGTVRGAPRHWLE